MSSQAPFRALIFDFDGLILDTETSVYEGWRELYAAHGQPLTVETWAQCVGSDFGHYDPARDLERMLGRSLDWASLNAERRRRVKEMLEGAEALPGVRTLLDAAQAADIPCAVASSSPREWVVGWLEKLALLPYFSQVTTLEDTGRVKPDPSLFLHAAEKLDVAPESIIVLEDSLNGLRAAKAAGMRCIIVPCTITAHLQFEGEWRKHDSLTEITLELLREDG